MTGLRLGNGHELPGLSMLIGGTVKPVREVKPKTNHAQNPSFETNELNWVSGAGGQRTQISTYPYVGSKCLQVEFAAAGTFKYVGQSTIITPGKSYIKASVAVRHITGAGFAKMRVGYRDHPTTGALTYGALTSGVPINADWSILNIGHAIPATTQHLVVIVYATDTAEGSAVAAGSSWAIDAMNISLGSADADTPEPNYFDGDTPAAGDYTYSWEGVPGASTSTAKP